MPLGLKIKGGSSLSSEAARAYWLGTLDLNMTTGKDFEKLNITSTSAGGTTGPLVPVYAGDSGTPGVSNRVYVPKPAGMLAGWDGVRLVKQLLPTAARTLSNWTVSGVSLAGSVFTAASGGNFYYEVAGTSAANKRLLVKLRMRLISGTSSHYLFAGSNGFAAIEGYPPSTGAISIDSEWKTFVTTCNYDSASSGAIQIRINVGGDCAIELDPDEMCIADITGQDVLVPPVQFFSDDASGWITDATTGERVYCIGNGVAMSWTKPGGSVNGSGVFTPALGAAIPDIRWNGPRPAATFLNMPSNNVNSSHSGASNVTRASATSLMGFDTERITGTATNGQHHIYRGTTARSHNYLFKKVGSTRYIQINMDTLDGAGRYANYDLDTGAVTALSAGVTASAKLLSPGVISAHLSYSGTTTPSYSIVQLIDSSTATFQPSFVGTGYAVDWAMPSLAVEANTTELCATNGSNITRLAEAVAFPQPVTSAWTAVVGVDLSASQLSSEWRVLGLNYASSSALYLDTGNILRSFDGNSFDALLAGVNQSTTKLGVRISGSSVAVKIDQTIAVGSGWSSDPGTSVHIGQGEGGSAPPLRNQRINTVRIWDRALSDQELINA